MPRGKQEPAEPIIPDLLSEELQIILLGDFFHPEQGQQRWRRVKEGSWRAVGMKEEKSLYRFSVASVSSILLRQKASFPHQCCCLWIPSSESTVGLSCIARVAG